MKPIKALLPMLLILSGTAMVATTADAQLGGLGGTVVRNLPVKTPAVPNLLSGPTPISTSIKDAIWGDSSQDGFTPKVAARDLTTLSRTPQGGFVLAEGYYRMHAQSYCLHAGTHGPGGGDAYLLGPVKGSAREAVISILQNSVSHPEIDQHDIQMLLWAIVSRAKFEDLSPKLKGVAAVLLSKKQLLGLNRSALSVFSNPQLNSITGGMPGPVRTVIEAESRLRGLLTTPGSSYAEIERVAVLGGVAPRGEGSIDVPASRWSLHPDGYWVRYKPNGYSNTWVEIWVPKSARGIGKVYDPATAIAVPANTARQRLAQSGRVYAQH